MNIISKSKKMKEVIMIVRKVRNTSAPIIIQGETGTGKELIAKIAHTLSDRRNKPFIAINCAAIPSELMESEFFGYEKGAFTGAFKEKIGKLEYANGGTVFLDEISSMPINLQAKLLRVLQEKTFERIGSNTSIRVNVRFIAATNVSLEAAIKKGAFREDLYYRLKVIPIKLPPLRERKEDIRILIDYFFERYAKKNGEKIKSLTLGALAILMDYSWPGNVRELENLIERLIIISDTDIISPEEISLEFFPELYNKGASNGLRRKDDYRQSCDDYERKYVIDLLDKTEWKVKNTADLMNIHRNTLLMKMKKLGIKKHKEAS